ncbi:MAG TPA: nucleotide exchange factor GrpE, partial [Ilumatobacteraceae bacterium]|nr:nucleotide exchange factor GrpE [Ilumatobacteraceae bacterium]
DRTSEMGLPHPLHDTAQAGDQPASSVDEAEVAVEHDVEALLAERDSFKDIALRLQADFENYRKRIAVQTTDEIQRATSKIAEALLPILDACEAAFVLHPREIEPLFNSLLTELKKVGLEAMHLSDQPFDPNVAEAVMHEPGDTEHPVVTEVMRSGYTWQGKVLRPAMVKVRG